MTSTDLHSLLDRVREAKGRDRVLDGDIWRAVHPTAERSKRYGPVPPLTSSLDAVVALIEEKLPGWFYRVGRSTLHDGWANVYREHPNNTQPGEARRVLFRWAHSHPSPFSPPSSPPSFPWRQAMSKPDDIPQDVWETARTALQDGMRATSITEAVARAILAERERCAKLCDKEVREAKAEGLPAPALGALWCASAIRKGASHDHE